MILGDDDMEDMIEKIIEIDQKAFRRQQDTEKRIRENEKNLKEIYAKMEKEVIQKAKAEADEKYRIEMESCQKKIDDIKAKGDQEIKVLEEHFNKIHRDLSQSLFHEIFELS